MLFSITPSARNGFARNSCERFFYGTTARCFTISAANAAPDAVEAGDGLRAFVHGAERALPKGNGMRLFCKAESAKV